MDSWSFTEADGTRLGQSITGCAAGGVWIDGQFQAAGTTLYRSRKLAAERKMERTRENLARVSDILREIERQSQYLERQAKKAELYKRLVAELRELELRVVGRQWRGLQWELAEIDAQRVALTAAAVPLASSNGRPPTAIVPQSHSTCPRSW